ncbi:hypothetical protein Trydic_g18991 [Trypoxylus dichotomus]
MKKSQSGEVDIGFYIGDISKILTSFRTITGELHVMFLLFGVFLVCSLLDYILGLSLRIKIRTEVISKELPLFLQATAFLLVAAG